MWPLNGDESKRLLDVVDDRAARDPQELVIQKVIFAVYAEVLTGLSDEGGICSFF